MFPGAHRLSRPEATRAHGFAPARDINHLASYRCVDICVGVYNAVCVHSVYVCIQDDRLSLAIFLLSPFLCLFSFPFLFNSLSGSFSLSLGFFSLSFVFRLIFLLFRCLSRFKLHLSVCFHIYLPIYLHTY